MEHPGVMCDGCRLSPIRGTRHKCDTRSNFTHCQGCMGPRDAPATRSPALTDRTEHGCPARVQPRDTRA
eukprot:CAMPEP_0198431752 /NCGR_PEP_ID=MMETSP1452-20131203/20321_1 /TAXON_ID=1181717 /ORGANISM="Synchroma pusillum, Strain CCMP3072" /LENGTH=68 /DNA_ID=CAMNT_0044152217 /DNA_START=35 /DNA_END=238 /DNA_ORIENTATION=-